MSSSDSSTNANLQPPPSPPRLTGDYQADSVIINDYLWDFYTAAVQSGLLNPQAQATAQPIDPSNLPDPANTTIATAQLTANLAYQFAQTINAQLAADSAAGFPVTEPTSES
jgi:hypothetical protein